jgi:diguanylate cyclase (GGDEF)-like protein/PAS domain S-box-containing protein
MKLLSVMGLLAGMVYLYVGGYAFRLNPRSRLHRIFALLCLVLTWWAFFYAFVYASPDKASAWFWFKLSAPGWTFIGGVGLHLVLLLTGEDRRWPKGWLYVLLYLPASLVLIRVWTGTVTARDFVSTPLGWAEVLASDSPWLWFHSFYYSGCTLWGSLVLFRWGRRYDSRLQKRQAGIFLMSVALFYGLGTLFNIVLPLVRPGSFPSIAPIFGLFWAYGIWKSIVEYRFLLFTPVLAADTIFKAMRDLLILTNEEGVISQVNPQVEKVLGYPEEELLGKPLFGILADEAPLKEGLRLLTRDDLPLLRLELMLKSRVGERIPGKVTLSFVQNDKKEVIGWTIIVEDLRTRLRLEEEIQVRKKTEEALLKAQADLEQRIQERTEELYQANQALQAEMVEREEMERLFRTLFVQSPIGTYIAQKGYFQMVNPAFERATGYSEKELLAIPALSLVHPEGRQEVRNNAVKMLRGERHQPYEFRFITKDGRVLWILETVTSIQYQGLRATLGSFMDITQRKESEETIRKLAFQDSLTGLANRPLLLDRLSLSLVQAQRQGRGLALMMVDLDGFKEINDRFGHQQGDLVLKEVGRRLVQFLRKSDTVARMGGDEFVILLPDVGSDEDAERIAGKLLEIIQRPIEVETGPVRVTASIGLALFPRDGQDGETLLKIADRAMYQAKEDGKNRLTVYGRGRMFSSVMEMSLRTRDEKNRVKD